MTLELLSHTCSIEERSGDLAGQGNMLTLCRACLVTTAEIAPQIITPSVGPECLGRKLVGCRPSPGLLLTKHTAIIGTKAEPAFIRKNNRSPLRPPMSSSLTPITSQMAVIWNQWNARYRRLNPMLPPYASEI
ncbi:hypothetical protein AVEN_87012-1 [Araneus ventricosus]|uniref:Uncharacterized protein n=1 Tax=Araneus ventricosus TaxID=182803 RepID=A0A4Y2UNU1_ARAVE|nr:hypothetical protein AVEN_87012-1 [Araneus ventricosus]